jgi:hypothetical protein
MKRLLYAAANPEGNEPLRLEAEITAIQERLSGRDVALDPVFLPDLDAGRLEAALMDKRPDILHLAAHGDDDILAIRKIGGGEEELTADTLDSWFRDPAPKIVYINACKSERLAERLVELGRVDVAIGTNAAIQNQAARAAAVTFYSRIISGHTVRQAFRACSEMASFQQKSVGLVLKERPGTKTADTAFIQNSPLLVARFVDNPPAPRPKGWFAFQLGIIGCPAQIHQVIFFTDDHRYALAGKSLEENMSTLVKATPRQGEFWVPVANSLNWYTQNETRVFATGVAPDGSGFLIEATEISDAVERFFLLFNGGVVPPEVKASLNKLLPEERLVRFHGYNTPWSEVAQTRSDRARSPDRIETEQPASLNIGRIGSVRGDVIGGDKKVAVTVNVPASSAAAVAKSGRPRKGRVQ